MNKILFSLLLSASATFFNAQTSCNTSTASNNMEDAYGDFETAILANDFKVNANTTMSISKITVNVAENANPLTSLSFFIYDNTTDNKPKTELSKVTLTPTSSVKNGTYVGLNFKTYTFVLPQAITVNNNANSTSTFWIGIGEGVGTGTGYIETTSKNISNAMKAYISTTNSWINTGYEGVFSLTASCSTTLATNEAKQSNISIYPNPVQKQINFNGVKTINNLEIYNTSGNLVKKATNLSSNNTVEVSSLPKGNYILNGEFDGVTKSFKFTKQ